MTEIDKDKIPQHVAIIMDGNGRWAKERKSPRTSGHLEGVKRVEDVVNAAQALGVKVLTLFTFSSENWLRPKDEVSFLMNMIDGVVKKKLDRINKLNIRFQILGRKERIPEPVLTTIKNGIEKTKGNNGMVLNLAFNYGSRLEIIDAFKNIVNDVKNGKISVENISENMVSNYLYTRGLPDPDLLIRTSGEKRISNFLLWQLSYAEFYFTDTLWPDFNEEEFKKAIIEYQSRERRFGALKEEET